MADNGKEKSEWDMVSLSSSSTYTERGDPSESSLFTSGHFVFPPSEHENLPIVNTEEEREDEEEEEEREGFEEEERGERGERVQFFEEGRRVSVYDSDEETEPERQADILLEREKDSKQGENNEKKLQNLPCEAWWKRHAIYLYKNAKEANSFWSILVASALMGLVILGHRWHKEKWEINSRWKFNLNNERMSRILSRPSH
ncbi:hypothetical protein LUZ60_002371 [Juncus effusus]|nr:hypothetical protein LUZ60_002371 [Juncus effusus]